MEAFSLTREAMAIFLPLMMQSDCFLHFRLQKKCNISAKKGKKFGGVC